MVARSDEFFDAVQSWLTAAGYRVFVWEATGRPAFPYAVIDPHWESEPDIGGPLVDPAAQYVGLSIASYGRATADALWLDDAIYRTLIDRPIPTLAVQVIYREGDSTPIVTFTEEGVMLSKHRYCMTYR